MVKHTNLCSRTAKIHRSHSPEANVTNITSHHAVPTVRQPTENTPDTYSLVDTTEKLVEEQIVRDYTLLKLVTCHKRTGTRYINQWLFVMMV